VHAEFLSRDICCLEIDGEYLVKIGSVS
jgi:hypothetical protein